MYFVYIIYSQKLDKYYIGFSADIEDRIAKHNRKSKGFSNLGRPWILVYSEAFDSKKKAMKEKTTEELEEQGSTEKTHQRWFRASRLTSREGRGFESLIAHNIQS